jgi:hypothetical protein
LIVLPTAHKASTSQYIFTDALGRDLLPPTCLSRTGGWHLY